MGRLKEVFSENNEQLEGTIRLVLHLIKIPPSFAVWNFSADWREGEEAKSWRKGSWIWSVYANFYLRWKNKVIRRWIALSVALFGIKTI